MRTTATLNSIMDIIHGLSLSSDNKRWLAEKLLEEANRDTKSEEKSYAEFVESLCGAWSDDPRSAEEISEDIRKSRQFGVTRHIMPLTDDEII